MEFELVENPGLEAKIKAAKAKLQNLIDTPFDRWTAQMKRTDRPVEIIPGLYADILEGEVIVYEEDLPPVRRMYEIPKTGNVVHLVANGPKVWAWVDREILEFLSVEDAAEHFKIQPARVRRHLGSRTGIDEELQVAFEWAN